MGIGVRTSGGGGWGAGSAAIALVAIGELALAGAALVRGVALDTTGMVVAVAVGIGSIVMLGVSPVPRAAKAVLIVALCAAGMSLSVAQDPFGLRSVDRKVTAATRTGASVASVAEEIAAKPAPGADARVTISTAEASADSGFAPALATAVATALPGPGSGDLAITGVADVAAGPREPTYSVTWSVAQRDVHAWCGRVSASSSSRPAAIDQLARRVVLAADRVAHGATGCA